MTTADASLTAQIPEILTEWQAITAEEPWMSLPKDHRVDNLVPVLRILLRASADSGAESGEAEVRELVEESARHGQHRRDVGFPDGLILVEYQLLREAIWRVAQRSPMESGERARCLLRIDAAMTAATRAALAGYHRAALDAVGRWPEAVDNILRDVLELELLGGH